jgi:hypothetical protein
LIFAVHHVQQNLHAIAGYVSWRAFEIPDLLVPKHVGRLGIMAQTPQDLNP